MEGSSVKKFNLGGKFRLARNKLDTLFLEARRGEYWWPALHESDTPEQVLLCVSSYVSSRKIIVLCCTGHNAAPLDKRTIPGRSRMWTSLGCNP